MNIYLLNFNNYYNRQAKRLPNIQDYLPYLNVPVRTNINFKPNDNVNTTLIQNDLNPLHMPDYLIAEDEVTHEFSRWFVMNFTRLGGTQYNLVLRRDLIVESIYAVLDAPCYVEKATLDDSDPMIVNDEKFPVNQIKKEEIALYDYTYSPWIVQYLPSNIADRIPDDELDKYGVKHLEIEQLVECDYIYDEGPMPPEAQEPTFTRYIYKDYLNQAIPETNPMFSTLLAENGKYIYYYTPADIYPNSRDFLYKLYVHIENYNGITYLSLHQKKICEYLQPIAPENDYAFKIKMEIAITKSALLPTRKSPYVILCAPYSDLATVDKSLTLKMFQSLATKYGSGEIYDTQILPYCPLRDLQVNRESDFWQRMANPNITFERKDGEIAIDGISIFNKNVYSEEESKTPISILGYCYENSFTFDIDIDMSIKPNENIKLINQTEMLRLCSPNYSGAFEFNRAKNRGFTKVNVDCTYKPFNPYIHLNPNFNFLYGKDFNDNRGLICSGDFSVDQETSRWADYQMNNKNYEAIFNREIENMEYNHKWDSAESTVGAIAGTVTGAMTGMFLGGPAGAIGGGIASGVGGALDIAKNQYTFNEALDYKKDMYGYNIANIKAMPNTLAKTSSINYNSKYVPFIEVYDCTEKEKQSFLEKIEFNGMTVNRIDFLRSFVRDKETYMKGKIIRINLNEDFHYVNELANEVDKGFFILRSDIE